MLRISIYVSLFTLSFGMVQGFAVNICLSKASASVLPILACQKSWSGKFVGAQDLHPQIQPNTKNRIATHTSIAAVQTEFELNRGAAVDTLLHDYPNLFIRTCDFSIFTDEVALEDVQGFRIEGLSAYRAFFSVVSSMINVCFSKCETSVVLMDKYAFDKSRIKLRWRINLFSRLPGSLGDIFRWIDSDGNGIISSYEYSALHQKQFAKSAPQNEPFVVEGISVYKLDTKGRIFHHAIEITSPLSSSLAPLRELLPVSFGPTIPMSVVGCGESSDPSLDFLAINIDDSIISLSTLPIAAPLQSANPEPQPWAKIGGPRLQAFIKKLPKQCKEDYDCNPGTHANLQSEV